LSTASDCDFAAELQTRLEFSSSFSKNESKIAIDDGRRKVQRGEKSHCDNGN